MSFGTRFELRAVDRPQVEVLQVHATWVKLPYIGAGSNPVPEHIRVVHRGIKRQNELLRSHRTRSPREVWVRKSKLASRLVGLGRS
jgi:hypothetical protein